MKVLFLYVSTNMCRDGDLWFHDEGREAGGGTLGRDRRVGFGGNPGEEIASRPRQLF